MHQIKADFPVCTNFFRSTSSSKVWSGNSKSPCPFSDFSDPDHPGSSRQDLYPHLPPNFSRFGNPPDPQIYFLSGGESWFPSPQSTLQSLLNLLFLFPILQSKFLLVFCKQLLPVLEILDLDILKNTDVPIVAFRIQNVVIEVDPTIEGKNEKRVILPQPIRLGWSVGYSWGLQLERWPQLIFMLL